MTDDAIALFCYGADMDPTAVLAAHPGARFVARAWVPPAATALPPLPAIEALPLLPGAPASPPEAVWGILVRLPCEGAVEPVARSPIEATTDDGRRIAARVATEEPALADPADVVAAARYWELPPAYVRRLAAWAEEAA